MSQIFHRSTNTLSRATIFGAVFVMAALGLVAYEVQGSPYITYAGVRKPQPVPFSHQHHVAGLGIDCRYCHTSVETSSFAGIPPTKTCMNCHSQIWTNAQLLEPVRASYRSGKSLQWTRVNQLPDFVYLQPQHSHQQGRGLQHLPWSRRPDAAHVQARIVADGMVSGLPSCAGEKSPPARSGIQYALPAALERESSSAGWQSLYRSDFPGEALVKKYNSAHVRDITSCTTCHR